MDDLHRPRLLIVDDTPENLDFLNRILADYERTVALNGEKAVMRATADPHPDLILLDIMMPGMDGYEVCRRLKAEPLTREIPIIFVTARTDAEDETKGLALGAVDYITKPFNPAVVKARVRTHLSLRQASRQLESQNQRLEIKVAERTRELSLTQDVFIQSLATLAETRDNETGGHIRRTQKYMALLANHLRQRRELRDLFTERVIELLYKSAPLHDIGKVGVPDGILLKPGRLTADEFEVMKKHCLHGLKAIKAAEAQLGSNSFLRVAKEIVYYHHEKWDGSGYPQGLAGEAIPLAGRMMAVADVYDALISWRVYKEPVPHEKVVAIIAGERGTHFDPLLVDIFIELNQTFRSIALEFIDFKQEREALLAGRF